MTEFTANWLALREPFDHAARSSALVDVVADPMRVRTSIQPATTGSGNHVVVDLASGTGSNVRYLRPRLPGSLRWRLVDQDAALLSRATASLEPICGKAAFTTCATDVSTIDAATLVAGCALVTASALLDLVSEAWIVSLARACRRLGVPALFALTYNGRIRCSPADEYDDAVRDFVNHHQTGDKGFGPALGPGASASAARAYAALGYDVRRERSDWQLGPDACELQRQLIDGWAAAAIEMDPGAVDSIRAWRHRRHAHVEGGTSRMIVGHEDLAACLR